MSNFLNSFGWALLPFFLGIAGIIESIKANNQYKIPNIIKYSLFICVGVFYMFYCIIPMSDYTNQEYYMMITGLSVVSTVFVYYAIRAFRYTEEILKIKIQKLIHFIFKTTPEAHKAEMWNTLKDVSNE